MYKAMMPPINRVIMMNKRYTTEHFDAPVKPVDIEDKPITARQQRLLERQEAEMLADDQEVLPTLDIQTVSSQATPTEDVEQVESYIDVHRAKAQAIREVEANFKPRLTSAAQRDGIITHTVKQEYVDFLMKCVIKGVSNADAVKHLRTSTSIKSVTASKILKLVRPLSVLKALKKLAKTDTTIKLLIKHTTVNSYTFGHWANNSNIGAVMNILRKNIEFSETIINLTQDNRQHKADIADLLKRVSKLESVNEALTTHSNKQLTKLEAQSLAQELLAQGLSVRNVATEVTGRGYTVSYKTIARWSN